MEVRLRGALEVAGGVVQQPERRGEFAERAARGAQCQLGLCHHVAIRIGQ
jgi:hypothetical protein